MSKGWVFLRALLSRPSTPCGIQTADFTSLPSEATTGPAQTPFPRTKFPSIPIPLINLRPIRMPFESLLHKKYLDKLSRVAVTYTVNVAFHSAPSSHSGTRPPPAPRIPPRPRTLCARRLSRPVRGVGVYPDRVGAFNSSDLCPLDFKLLAQSVAEGSTACPVYPVYPEQRREGRREHCRRVNRLLLRRLLLRLPPAVDCKLSAVSGRPLFANSHRIIFFAHPHPLTPIESYSCKKRGGGVPYPELRATGLMSLRDTQESSQLHSLHAFTSQLAGTGGGELGQKKKEGTMNRAATQEVVSFMWKSYPQVEVPPSGNPPANLAFAKCGPQRDNARIAEGAARE